MQLVARNITHNYPGAARPILDQISLAIEGGESLALVGPSGSGKTTLLSILGGLLSPSSGSVVLTCGEREIHATSAAERRRNVSWIFQTTNAVGHRSVLENVSLGPLSKGLGVREAHKQSVAQLERVGLGGRERELARHLSGGELQRLGIARALATPNVLVLADEPTGQIDHELTSQLTAALLSHNTGGTALVLATHDRSVAAACDRALTIDSGRLHVL